MITGISPILTFLLAKGVGTKTLSDVVEHLVSRNHSPDDVGLDTLADELGLRAELKQNVLAARDQADKLAKLLDRENIRILIRGMNPYPQRLVDALGKNAPPVLFVRGNLAIFDTRAVGFCGSRDASEKGISVAAESARLLGARGVNVVSGYAKGVDLAAHCASLEAGGTTSIVLAEGILHFRAKREIKSLLADDNYLVISELSPMLPWNVRNAMMRNNTIIGLSDAMIVIESGTTGGTHACATTALSLRRPLFVAEYAAPAKSAAGNKHFLDSGATPLRGNGQGSPNLAQVYEVLGLDNSDANGSTKEVVLPSKQEEPASAPARSASEVPTSPAAEDKSSSRSYPRRLIEVDLPIARISAHARREKSIRHGHISTLHIWWARRPLAACRAVICAALWPDPADPLCPQSFRDAAARHLIAFARRVFPERITDEKALLHKTASAESLARWEVLARAHFANASGSEMDSTDPAHQNLLRFALLDFIADFANWDNSTVPAYLETARALTQAAHEALGGEPGTRPLVVDPFAGGGSIPLEALRVGADAFASDLNPVAVLLNKVVLEYIPKYGQKLADEVRKWGQWIKEQAEKELAEFYPKDPDGATPIAYLWARTIRSAAPVDSDLPVEVPLIRSLWLSKRKGHNRALRWVRDTQGQVQTRIVEKSFADGVKRLVRQPMLEIFEPSSEIEVAKGTSAGGSATCPVTGFTTSVEDVRVQMKSRRGGAADSRLLCVVVLYADVPGRKYRVPSEQDQRSAENAALKLGQLDQVEEADMPVRPDGKLNHLRGFFNVVLYGMETWGDLFSPRQLLALNTLSRLVCEAGEYMQKTKETHFAGAVQTCLALALGKQADSDSSLCAWRPTTEDIGHTFGRQALPMVWDYVEGNIFSGSTRDWMSAVEGGLKAIASIDEATNVGQAAQASAVAQLLPDGMARLTFTDPPYYAAVPYADLSDFFYSWLQRALRNRHPELFATPLTPKDDECVMLAHRAAMYRQKDAKWFEQMMGRACRESYRVTSPNGVGVFVFASKETPAWEAMLAALTDAGWTISASWPVDTEMGSRLRAKDSAVLASSVHIIARPRTTSTIGDWRDILSDLPQRMHEWMPRLASEGVVGADAIFACLGPALEIFSRYSRVEKANGDPVLLKEYLEHVWAAVSKEALSTIFRDADASSLEPDARLTAMWLWTLGHAKGKTDLDNRIVTAIDEAHNRDANSADVEADDEEEAGNGKSGKSNRAGYFLEFDAARLLAQGLGIHLDKAGPFVEVKGDSARLLPVAERTKYLFGKDTDTGATGRKKPKKKAKQPSLFEELNQAEEAEAGRPELKGPPVGATSLDRLHQAMILFGAQRGELLKRFLVEDGVGKDARFWKLAQSLAALYPPGTDERRWVEGVLARKKGLGL